MASVAHSEGVMPNGVVASQNGAQVFINLYGEDKVRVVDANRPTILTELDIRSADNTNWDITQANKLLVASHDFNFLSMSECMSGGDNNCVSPFEIIELIVMITVSGHLSSVMAVFGAATAAVDGIIFTLVFFTTVF